LQFFGSNSEVELIRYLISPEVLVKSKFTAAPYTYFGMRQAFAFQDILISEKCLRVYAIIWKIGVLGGGLHHGAPIWLL